MSIKASKKIAWLEISASTIYVCATVTLKALLYYSVATCDELEALMEALTQAFQKCNGPASELSFHGDRDGGSFLLCFPASSSTVQCILIIT